MLCYIFRLSLKQSCGKNKQPTVVFDAQATPQWYPGRDTFEFDQGHVTKNQPIPVLVLLGESLGIKQYYSFWLPSKSQKECTDHYLSQHVFNLVSQFASQGTYSNPPTVFVTAKHHRKGLKHDAASVWLEDVSAASFKICLRELQNFAGVHEEISVVSFIKSGGTIILSNKLTQFTICVYICIYNKVRI